GLGRLAHAVVFELGKLCAAIAEHSGDLSRVRARTDMLIIGLTGISVPNSIFERLFLARKNPGNRTVGIVEPELDLLLGVVTGRNEHSFLVPIKGVGNVQACIGYARSVRPDRIDRVDSWRLT